MKKDIEKIVLIVVLVLVVLGAGYFAFFFPTEEEFKPRGGIKQVWPEEISPEVLGTVQNDWMNPPQWTAPDQEHFLFISDRYLVLPNGKIIPVSPDEVITPGGITLGWAEKYGLDITDGSLDYRDPDKDGFYNLLEFKGETIPTDKDSHPPYVSNAETSRLRMDGYDEVKFAFKLMSVTPLDNQNIYFLQKIGDTGRVQSVRVNPGMSEDEQRKALNGYILGKYTEIKGERFDDKIGIMRKFDDSTLELLQPEIGRKVVLIMRQEIPSPDSTGDFIMLLPGEMDKQIKVPRGGTFSVPQEPGVTYILIEARQGEGAKIRREDETKEIIMVPLATSEEKRIVQQLEEPTPENPQ